MKDIDFAKDMLHDSARERYRSPMGAVTGGTRITFRLSVRELVFEKAYLTVLRGSSTQDIEMYSESENTLAAEFEAPGDPEVLWYWFSVRLAENSWIYYGAAAGCTSGVGKLYWNTPPAYQLTVHDQAFLTPNWFKHATMYQVFPDRFRRGIPDNMETGETYHRGRNREVYLHENWNEEPLYQPVTGKMFYQPCDYFGGDLAGIGESLDYFRDMGVTVLYLNPIFEAASNHRYNTGDYLEVDPFLGNLEDFQLLVKRAEQRGIKIILDGVFSHTGDDSVYFNKYGNYNDVGAYQSKESPYYNWYQFDEYPDHYKSWWGFETLPEVNEHNQDWIDFVIENDDSVINTWLDRGAAGFRLDVADELPDDTIEKMRTSLKHNGQDNVLLGEVWEDATIKQSYGTPRTYALGRGLDSVMNYPFTNAVVDFLLFNLDAYALKGFLVGQCQNYPKEMYYCLMNLLSSHDVARIRTRLATRVDGHGLTREQQACFVVTDEQDSHGAIMQKLAAAIQFSLPGVPCIYYGDESGMNGLMDPFNRRPYTKCGNDITEYYKTLSNIRKEYAAMQTGHVAFLTRAEDLLGILRICVEGQDALGMEAADGATLTVVNRSKAHKTFVCDLFAEHQCLPLGYAQFFRDVELKQAKSLITGAQWDINEGLVSIDIAPESADVVEILWL